MSIASIKKKKLWQIIGKVTLKSVSCSVVCLTLCDPMDCSLPGSSVHGILQAGILEWGAMPSSRGPSQPRDQTQISCIAGGFFTLYCLSLSPLLEYKLYVSEDPISLITFRQSD